QALDGARSTAASQPLFLNGHHDDALTVQVSDANSHLGHLLLEADWAEALTHLATPEGQRDVDAKNDPLGLFNSRHLAAKYNKHAAIPSSKNTAFFAALFVRAPYDVIGKIFTMTPSHVDEPEDLMYAMSVIPSEEESRLQDLRRKVPHRTRAWTAEEYDQILNLLLQSFIYSKSPPSSLLNSWPPWMIGNSNLDLSPLAIASYNPDISVSIVQILCALEPQAMEKECIFSKAAFRGVQTVPIIIAAASPLPPDSSISYNDAKNLRWEKVKLLTLPKVWYDEQRENLLKSVDDAGETNNTCKRPLAASPPPEPTLQHIQHACRESMRRNEWELVREFLKHYYPDTNLVETSISILKPIKAALTQHDEKIRAAMQRQQTAQEKSRAREEWLHKNMGLIMYPINAVLDLVSAVIPSSRKKHDEWGIVSPMS
ncbi:hypothetical protein ACHAXR_002618, partial [Thalassiosira sp. AJA248-18]